MGQQQSDAQTLVAGANPPSSPTASSSCRRTIFPLGRVDRYSADGRIVWTAEEYRNDEVFGHMVFLRINKLIEPVSTGFMGGPTAVHFPPNSETYDLVRAAGGISIAAHDVAMEVPLQVLLGKLDSLDAYGTSRYYDLLNCGFRLPLSVGSDYPANLMGFAGSTSIAATGWITVSGWTTWLPVGHLFRAARCSSWRWMASRSAVRSHWSLASRARLLSRAGPGAELRSSTSKLSTTVR